MSKSESITFGALKKLNGALLQLLLLPHHIITIYIIAAAVVVLPAAEFNTF